MSIRNKIWSCLVVALALGLADNSEAKSYSGGGGRSYSSSSSSRSSSSGGSHSFGSSGSSRSSSGSGGGRNSASAGGGGKQFSSGGKSYGSGSSSSDDGRQSYSSAKSYSSGSDHAFSSHAAGGGPARNAGGDLRAANPSSMAPNSDSGFSFDKGAARARKEEASRQEFNRFKQSSLPKPLPGDSAGMAGGNSSYKVTPPPLPSSGSGSYHRPVYVPDRATIVSRPTRIYNVFYPYYSRPMVLYHDPYNSFFWWWLLDRTLDDRAMWAYHHRLDMDPARYQALVGSNQQLENRIAQLEAQQTPRDPSYVPPGLDQDLMYSDRHVKQAYSNRPTASGRIVFWLLGVPLALGASGFFIWLLFFKRWQPAHPLASTT